MLVVPFIIIGYSLDTLWHFKFNIVSFTDEMEELIDFIKTGEI